MINFEYYNNFLIKNILYSYNFVGVINLSEVESDWQLHKIIFNANNNKLDVSIFGDIGVNEQDEYKEIILTIIELFFLCDLSTTYEEKKLTLSIAKDIGYIFKFTRELPVHSIKKIEELLSDFCALDKESFKVRYSKALKSIHSLDGKSSIDLSLLSIIRDHSAKIFTNTDIINDDSRFFSIIVVIDKLNQRSWSYNEPRLS